MPFGAARFKLSEPAQGSFFKFNLTAHNLMRMNPEADLPDYFRVKVRLDSKGIGGADKEGDLTGELSSIRRGSKDVSIRITHLVSITKS